jgi:hypothetical protein
MSTLTQLPAPVFPLAVQLPFAWVRRGPNADVVGNDGARIRGGTRHQQAAVVINVLLYNCIVPGAPL